MPIDAPIAYEIDTCRGDHTGSGEVFMSMRISRLESGRWANGRGFGGRGRLSGWVNERAETRLEAVEGAAGALMLDSAAEARGDTSQSGRGRV